MAKTIKVATVAGWVYLEDDNSVVEVKTAADAPEGATVFRLRSMPIDSVIQMGIAVNARERSEGIGIGLRGVVAEARGLVDDDGNEVAFSPELLDALPIETLMALGQHVVNKVQTRAKEVAARRGNERSGSSRGRRRSGGTPTAGSRTASPVTN
jgi:hypothetical protein